MLFVLCVSLSSCEAGGGVLTFVLTLVLMFITTATITEQKPRSTLLQSWRKNRQASPLWEGAFEKTSRRDSDKFRFIFPQHFTQCEASASPCFTRSNFREATSAQRCPALPLTIVENCSTIARRPCPFLLGCSFSKIKSSLIPIYSVIINWFDCI